MKNAYETRHMLFTAWNTEHLSKISVSSTRNNKFSHGFYSVIKKLFI